jgi:hypothetical protein
VVSFSEIILNIKRYLKRIWHRRAKKENCGKGENINYQDTLLQNAGVNLRGYQYLRSKIVANVRIT